MFTTYTERLKKYIFKAANKNSFALANVFYIFKSFTSVYFLQNVLNELYL